MCDCTSDLGYEVRGLSGDIYDIKEQFRNFEDQINSLKKELNELRKMLNLRKCENCLNSITFEKYKATKGFCDTCLDKSSQNFS